MSQDQLRVLLVEDSSEDALLVEAELRRGGFDPECLRVDGPEALRTALDWKVWDVVIADHRLPRFSGLEALSILRERGLDLPFILVSGAVGEDVAVGAMKAGANDYVMKDKLARLAPAIRRELVEADVRRKRREAEEGLRKANKELEIRVRERTSELSQANARLRGELEERRSLEEDRNRMFVELLRGQKLQAIGQLAAGVAHEINNPAGWILSNLGTIEKYFQTLQAFIRDAEAAVRTSSGAGSADLANTIGKLHEGAEVDFLLQDLVSAVRDSREGALRIRDIVASLKSFSHPDEKEPEKTNLADLLENAIKLCAGELKYKAALVRNFGQIPPVLCRPQQIEQVLINLLVNAAQAIPGQGEITLSTSVEGPEAVVRIRDTGAGIPPERMKRLFEPFFTTKPVGKGTGLGLHVAYKIVKAHGGRIHVTSTVGRGTEVTVRLPLAREAPAKGPGEPGKPLVVLVDDDAAALRTLRRALAHEPVRILSTRDPRKAVEWAANREVHLMLSDHRMPEMSGTSLLGEVARRSPDTRRLLVTAFPESPEVKEARGITVEEVIRKPWDGEELSRAVRRVLGLSPKEGV